MTDPFTAGAITSLAFTKLFESGAGELGKQLTGEAIKKIETLRAKIWQILKGKSEKVDEALVKADQGDQAALSTVAKYLDVAMEDDPDFASEIIKLAEEIHQEIKIDKLSGKNVLAVFGGTGTQINDAKAPIFKDVQNSPITINNNYSHGSD